MFAGDRALLSAYMIHSGLSRVCLSVPPSVHFCGSVWVVPSVCVSVRVHFSGSVRVLPSVCLFLYVFVVH